MVETPRLTNQLPEVDDYFIAKILCDNIEGLVFSKAHAVALILKPYLRLSTKLIDDSWQQELEAILGAAYRKWNKAMAEARSEYSDGKVNDAKPET